MKTTSLKVVLATGETKHSVDVTNNYGHIKGAFVTIADETNLPNDIVKAALTDVNSRPFVELDVREWKRRTGGSFYSSMIPLALNHANLKFQLNTSTAPTSDVVLDVVLVHENDDLCASQEY